MCQFETKKRNGNETGSGLTPFRAKSVHLTTKGKTMASKLVPIVEKIDEEFFGVISTVNQQSLINILDDLVSKIEIAE